MNERLRSDEIEQLKTRLAQYEKAFAKARPQIAAFQRLEELAEAQATTPEAMAREAAIAVQLEQENELRQSVEQLNTEREIAREELSVTLKHKKEVGDEMTLIQNEHDSLAYEVSELISEIESIRVDAIRLMKERSALQLEVEALRNERAAVDGEQPVVDVVQQTDAANIVPGKTDVSNLDAFEEDDAFSRFIDVDRGKDKARDWFVG